MEDIIVKYAISIFTLIEPMFYTNFSESKPPIDFELDILSEQYNQVNDELFYYYSGLKRLFNFMIQESKEYLPKWYKEFSSIMDDVNYHFVSEKNPSVIYLSSLKKDSPIYYRKANVKGWLIIPLSFGNTRLPIRKVENMKFPTDKNKTFPACSYCYSEGENVSFIPKEGINVALLPLSTSSNDNLFNTFFQSAITFKYFIYYLSKISKNHPTEIQQYSSKIRWILYQSIFICSPFYYSHDEYILNFIDTKIPNKVYSNNATEFFKASNLFLICKKLNPHLFVDNYIKNFRNIVEQSKYDIYKYYVDLKIKVDQPFLPQGISFPKIINKNIKEEEINRLLSNIKSIMNSNSQANQFYIILNDYAESFCLYPPCNIDKIENNIIHIKFVSFVPKRFILINSENENIENIEISRNNNFVETNNFRTDAIPGSKEIYIRFNGNIQQSRFIVQNQENENLAIILYQNRKIFINDLVEFFDNWKPKDDQNILSCLKLEEFKKNECSTRLSPIDILSIEEIHKPHLIYLRGIYLITYNWINNNFIISNNYNMPSLLSPKFVSDKFMKEVKDHTANESVIEIKINRKNGNNVRNNISTNKDLSMISQFSRYFNNNKNKFKNYYNGRPFRVDYIGEQGIDASGLMRDFISELVKDINNENVGLFIKTPNGKKQKGLNRECVIPTPDPNVHNTSNLYTAVGGFIGILIRTGMKQSELSFPYFFWKYLCDARITFEDIYEIDEDYKNSIDGLRELYNSPELTDDNFEERASSIKLYNSRGNELKLTGMRIITRANFERYIAGCNNLRITELTTPLSQIRSGFWENLGFNPPNYVTPSLLSFLACGEGKLVTYKFLQSRIEFGKASNISNNDFKQHKNMILQCIREFTNEERKSFIEFVTGLNTLPNDRKIDIYIWDSGEGLDQKWPNAHTCFFRLDLPLFSTREKMMRALRYVINNAKTFENS